MKITFLSFADSRMSTALIRIRKQAEEMHLFEDIRVLNEKDLDVEFLRKWKGKLKPGSRGFGYWIWKPYIILETIQSMPEGSILVYCDVGCHLNKKGVEKLKYYLNELIDDTVGIKAFKAYFSCIDIKEKRWTKGDIFDFYNCRYNEQIYNTDQVASGIIFIQVKASSINLIKKWMTVYEINFSLVDDSKSKAPNFPGFIENRHDQSIFSILYKLNGCTPFPSTDIEPNNETLSISPILVMRDRGYKEKNIFKRIKRYIRAKFFLYKINKEKKNQTNSS